MVKYHWIVGYSASTTCDGRNGQTAFFPGESGSSSSTRVIFKLFRSITSGISETGFSRAGCPSCHPTISVTALKGTQSTNPNQWPGLNLSLSTTGFLTKATLPPLYWLSKASTSWLNLRHKKAKKIQHSPEFKVRLQTEVPLSTLTLGILTHCNNVTWAEERLHL